MEKKEIFLCKTNEKSLFEMKPFIGMIEDGKENRLIKDLKTGVRYSKKYYIKTSTGFFLEKEEIGNNYFKTLYRYKLIQKKKLFFLFNYEKVIFSLQDDKGKYNIEFGISEPSYINESRLNFFIFEKMKKHLPKNVLSIIL